MQSQLKSSSEGESAETGTQPAPESVAYTSSSLRLPEIKECFIWNEPDDYPRPTSDGNYKTRMPDWWKNDGEHRSAKKLGVPVTQIQPLSVEEQEMYESMRQRLTEQRATQASQSIRPVDSSIQKVLSYGYAREGAARDAAISAEREKSIQERRLQREQNLCPLKIKRQTAGVQHSRKPIMKTLIQVNNCINLTQEDIKDKMDGMFIK